jgi:hypothetical protein
MTPTGKQSLYVSRCLARASAGISRVKPSTPLSVKARVKRPPIATPTPPPVQLAPPVATDKPPDILSLAERKARQRAVIAMGPGRKSRAR